MDQRLQALEDELKAMKEENLKLKQCIVPHLSLGQIKIADHASKLEFGYNQYFKICSPFELECKEVGTLNFKQITIPIQVTFGPNFTLNIQGNLHVMDQDKSASQEVLQIYNHDYQYYSDTYMETFPEIKALHEKAIIDYQVNNQTFGGFGGGFSFNNYFHNSIQLPQTFTLSNGHIMHIPIRPGPTKIKMLVIWSNDEFRMDCIYDATKPTQAFDNLYINPKKLTFLAQPHAEWA